MMGFSTFKIFGILGAALALLLLVADRTRWVHRAHGAEAQVSAACDATRSASNRPRLDCKQMPQQIQFLGDALNNVRAKTEAAKAADLAHATEVESHDKIAGQETSHDYQAELARVRAEYDRLRHAKSGANPSGGGKPGVPSAPAVAGGPVATTEEGQLPPEDALIATEQALQLQAILNWGCKVGINPNCPH